MTLFAPKKVTRTFFDRTCRKETAMILRKLLELRFG